MTQEPDLEPVNPEGQPPIAPDVWRDAYAMIRGAVYDDNEGMAAVTTSADLPELARALALISNGFLMLGAQIETGDAEPEVMQRKAMEILEAGMRRAGAWPGP